MPFLHVFLWEGEEQITFIIIFVPGIKYFAGNYGFTLKKIKFVVVVVVVIVVVVVVLKSSERFKALLIELES